MHSRQRSVRHRRIGDQSPITAQCFVHSHRAKNKTREEQTPNMIVRSHRASCCQFRDLKQIYSHPGSIKQLCIIQEVHHDGDGDGDGDDEVDSRMIIKQLCNSARKCFSVSVRQLICTKCQTPTVFCVSRFNWWERFA